MVRAAPAALVWLLFLAACDAKLTNSIGDVQIDSTALTYGHVWVGHPRALPTTFVNGGRAARLVSIEATGPFRPEVARFQLAGGETRELQVWFEPANAGQARGRLAIQIDGDSTEVGLTGEASMPPDCARSAPAQPPPQL